MASLVIMRFLSSAQRRTGKALGSPAVVVDSAQTLRRRYLCPVLLVELVLDVTLGGSWAGPIAGLVNATVAVKGVARRGVVRAAARRSLRARKVAAATMPVAPPFPTAPPPVRREVTREIPRGGWMGNAGSAVPATSFHTFMERGSVEGAPVMKFLEGALMGDIGVIPLVDEGLGNSSYLLDLRDGRALAVDASRDLRTLREASERRGLKVAYAADTHLHADFLTGAVQLARLDGAQVLASAAGDREYPHTRLDDEDEVDLGGLRLRALATPGHTHEHIAFELVDGSRTLGVFTGGSLIVGSAARTDLVSPDRTEELARAQYRSLRRLAKLDDDVAVWPTHGAGSFCSAPPGAARTSTIGTERATNTLLRAESEAAFVKQLLDSLGTFPPYFLRLGEINRRGPAPLDGDSLTPLTAADVARLTASGAQLVDVRPVLDFGAAHVPGSVSIPLRPAFATWLGWLVDADRPVVVVRNADQDPAEVIWQARKVGYDQIVGELGGGIAAWTATGEPTTSIPVVGVEALEEARVLDIRQNNEYDAGHVPGADHIELGALATRAADLRDEPTVVMCGHGERAMGAASLLARAGRRNVTVLEGGPEDWAEKTGNALQAGQ